MLFAPGMSRFFATHPPLLERLKAIDPRFDPKEIDEYPRAHGCRGRRCGGSRSRAAAERRGRARDRCPSSTCRLRLRQWSRSSSAIRAPRTCSWRVRSAQSLPEAIVAAGRHPQSARALLLALALDSNRRHARPAEAGDRSAAHAGDRCDDRRSRSSTSMRWNPSSACPALLRAFPALRQLTREERMQLMACLNGMLQREGNVVARTATSCASWRKCICVTISNPGGRTQRLTLQAVQQDAQVLFSVLARHGHEDDTGARRAYEAGMHHLFPRERPAYAHLRLRGPVRSTSRSAGSISWRRSRRSSWSRRWWRPSPTISN